MKPFIKNNIRTIRLNSYRPLCGNAMGMRAVEQYGCKPFVDSSCRREPDFESNRPSITTLCRQDRFAPYLWPNDIVIYITKKGKWMADYRHYRLVAILAVIQRRDSHEQAAKWYQDNSLDIPSNSMIAGNDPEPFYKTSGNYPKLSDMKKYLAYPEEKQAMVGKRKIAFWDSAYQDKADKNGTFLITDPIYVNLTDPPILRDEDMTAIFGKVPNTRNPNIIRDSEQAKKLMSFAGIEFIYNE